MLNHSLKEIEKDFISLSPQGLYCPQANLHIDPWSSVENSINTHAHRDHISFGCGSYLCSEESKGVLGIRVGKDQKIEGLPYAKKININGDDQFPSCWSYYWKFANSIGVSRKKIGDYRRL